MGPTGLIATGAAVLAPRGSIPYKARPCKERVP